MDIKDITNQNLIKLKQACLDTIKLHQEALKLGISYSDYRYERWIDCPLCVASFYISGGHECKVCPWESIEHKDHCRRKDIESFDNSPASINRLTRWISIISSELESRNVT